MLEFTFRKNTPTELHIGITNPAGVTVVSLQSRFATSRFATLEVVSLHIKSRFATYLKSVRYTAKVVSLQPDNLSEFIQVEQSTMMAARKQCIFST